MSVNKYNSTTGNLERLDGYTVDSTPTQNSGNPVSSGGVFTALGKKLSVYDESYVTTQCGKDLNNCTTLGIYYLPLRTSHAPSSLQCTAMVVKSADNLLQYVVAQPLPATVFLRYKNDTDNVWTDWYKVDFVTA